MPTKFRVPFRVQGFTPTTPIEPVGSTSFTIIRFDKDFEVGSLTNPTFDDISVELLGFENSLAASDTSTVTIFNMCTTGVAPAFLTGWTNTVPGTPYSTVYGDLNTIVATFSGGTISYTVTVTPDYFGSLTGIPVKGLIWRGLERVFSLSNPSPDFSPRPVNGYLRFNESGILSVFDEDGYWGTNFVNHANKPVINIPSGGKINITFPFAISFWAKLPPGSPETSPRLFSTYDINPANLNVRLRTASTTDRSVHFNLNFSSTGNDDRTVISSEQLTDVWKHVYADYDGTTMRLFINNGTPVTRTGASVQNLVTSPHPIATIGGEWHYTINGNYGGACFMAYMRIYQGNIPTDEQRTAIYNDGFQKLNLVS